MLWTDSSLRGNDAVDRNEACWESSERLSPELTPLASCNLDVLIHHSTDEDLDVKSRVSSSGHDSFLVFFLFGESVFFLVKLELELRAASSRWFRLVAVLVFNPSPIYFQCLSTCFSSNQNFSLSCQQLVSVLSRDWFCPIRVSLV